MLDPEFLAACVGAAIGANACFFAGPLAEAYLRWLGLEGRWIGRCLFVLGLAVAVPLTLAVLSVLLFSALVTFD